MEYNITAYSKPDYDEWGWDDYWSCGDWIKWHQELKKVFGAKVAMSMFVQAWEAQDGTAHPYNWCKYNTTFYNYFKKEGVDESNVFMELFGAVGSIAEGAGSAAEGTEKLGKVLKVAIPVVAVLAIAGGIWWGYKKYIKPVGK